MKCSWRSLHNTGDIFIHAKLPTAATALESGRIWIGVQNGEPVTVSRETLDIGAARPYMTAR